MTLSHDFQRAEYPVAAAAAVQSQATAAPMNFDQGDNATSWTYYEPKTSTVNTKCESNCLPSQASSSPMTIPMTANQAEHLLCTLLSSPMIEASTTHSH